MLRLMGTAGVEARGQAIQSIVGGMEILRARAMKILAENGIPHLEPDRWYPMTAYLACLRAIEEKIGPNTLRSIGRKVPGNAVFPPEMRTLEQALTMLDNAYRMNHRGPGDFGSYRYERVTERSARMVCKNPYPCDLDLGLLEGLGERFQPPGSFWVRVEHDKGSCRKTGADACTYVVRW